MRAAIRYGVLIGCFALALPGVEAVRAQEQLLVSGAGAIPVEINKGKLVKLDQPISSVVIADPNIADVQVVSAKLLFVRGKKVGETSIYAVDDKDNPVFSASLQITHNLSKLEETVKRVSPDSDVTFRSIDGGLVMEGFSPSAGESETINNIASSFLGEKEKMLNNIKTAGSDQVMLQVKIVEMERANAKRFGINMQNAFGVVQILQGPDIEIDTNSALNGTSIEVDRLGLLDRGGGTGTQIMGRFRGNRLTNVIDALETQGLVSVLAEPSLITTSGKPASFLAGGEFPIAVNSGNNSISVQYKPFGVSLNFTPVVMSKDRISIAVAPEVSTISPNTIVTSNGINNPIVLTRKAQATIEMGSGQTFALAGLLKNDMSNSIAKFPGLGDVPILGTLFRSNQFQNNQTELIILVTPFIVRPVSDQTLQTPLDGYVPPTERQRVLGGQLFQQEPMEPSAPPPAPAAAPKAEHAPAPATQAAPGHSELFRPLLEGLGGFLTE